MSDRPAIPFLRPPRPSSARIARRPPRPAVIACSTIASSSSARRSPNSKPPSPTSAAPPTASAISSGTDAIQIAMMGEGVGPGDAVFLPAFTYTATAEVPLVLGATPVFVDVDPRTYQIDLAHLEARIEDVKRRRQAPPARRHRRRPVRPTRRLARPCSAIARKHDLFTLDDCAQSFGATHHGKPLGTQADATIASFFSLEIPRRLRRRRRHLHPVRREGRPVSQPAHPRRGRDPLPGPPHRHERPHGHDPGGRPALQARPSSPTS
jgi:hypothetical protein